MRLFMIFMLALVFLACEEEADDPTLEDQLVGTWAITNMGVFASSDCSGELSYTEWQIAQGFGLTMSYTFEADGSGEITSSFFGFMETEPFTWSVDGEDLCIEGECVSIDLSGNTMTFSAFEDAYCEDEDGNDLEGYTESTCTAAGYDWYDEACYEFTAEKE